MTSPVLTERLLWPDYTSPEDLLEIEKLPLAERGLPESTHKLLARAASLWPAKVAVRVLADGDHWREPVDRTFRQLADDVCQVANALRSVGAARRDAVALISPNCDQLLTCLLAAQAAGTAAPINPSLDVDHIEQLIRLSGARILVVAGPELDPAVWEKGRALARALSAEVLVALRPTNSGPSPLALEAADGVLVCYLDELIEGHGREMLTFDPPRADDVASWFHTGGTTGLPKLAGHTHANEIADAWMLAAGGDLDGDSVGFGALPLFHVNALVVTLLSPLFRGRPVVWAGPQGYRDVSLVQSLWKIVERYRIASLSGVPTIYAVLAQVPVDADISSLRFAAVGASPLPPAVREAFEAATGVPLVEGYGLTEATCASARSFPDHPRRDTVGQRLPYQQIKAVSTDPATGVWRDLPSGAVGNLVISGPVVFPGYLVGQGGDGPVLDGLGKLRDGWLETGDLGSIDDSGFVTLTGRAKDLIIRGGHNIDPSLIEDALLSHPDVTGAIAVGRPDVHAGEVPVGYVTLRPGAEVTADELKAHAAVRAPETAAAPKDVVIVDALPVTAVGKPYRLELRRDATHQVAVRALERTSAQVRTTIVDASPVVSVSGVDEQIARRALGGFAFRWRIAAADVTPPEPGAPPKRAEAMPKGRTNRGC